MRSKRTVKQHRENPFTGEKQIWLQIKLQNRKKAVYFVPCSTSLNRQDSFTDKIQPGSQPQSPNSYDQDQDLWEDIEDEVPQIPEEIQPTQKSQPNHSKIAYRNDIDGIRAVAILMVLIYHAFPQKLTGGFIGVDAFFVISGFLITQIITKEIIQGKFSILNFYCRRIKRIYPALILVLCFALWVITKLTHIDLINFSLETLNAALIFCTNFRIFLHNQDYFDADIRGNPLLHLWSLGVQEQFYIVWPFLLLLVFKYCRKHAVKILTVFTVCSFILSILIVQKNAKLAFYFPLCRFWQMSLGGILGYVDFNIRSPIVCNTLSALGLFSILITSFFIDEESLFPGFWALVPTLGCAFMIQAKNTAFINKKILSSKPFTFVGKISYSLYLWHWPLIVFSNVMYPEGSKSILSNKCFIVLLSVGMSILTYLIAENPIRRVKNKKIVVLLLFVMCLVGSASINLGQNLNENANKIKFEFVPQETQNNLTEEKDDAKKAITPIKQIVKLDQENHQQKKDTPKQPKQQLKEEPNKQTVQKKLSPAQLSPSQVFPPNNKPNKIMTKQQFYDYVYKQLAPEEEDYVTVDGKRFPNFSVNKKRIPPFHRDQVHVHAMEQKWEENHGGQKLLEKVIDQTTTFADMLQFLAPYYIRGFEFTVANDGKENSLFLVGDSHIEKISYRFQELFKRSKEAGTLDKFPTIVTSLKRGDIMGETNPLLNFTRILIQKHKPKRILFAWNWIYYFCKNLKSSIDTPASCNQTQAKEHITLFINFMKGFIQQGIQVYTIGVDMNHIQYLPERMFDANGVIEDNIKPFKYSDYRKKYKFIYDLVEGALNDAKINWIDTAKFLCWEDTCHVISPKGFAPFCDIDHMGKLFSANWFTIFDHLVEF